MAIRKNKRPNSTSTEGEKTEREIIILEPCRKLNKKEAERRALEMFLTKYIDYGVLDKPTREELGAFYKEFDSFNGKIILKFYKYCGWYKGRYGEFCYNCSRDDTFQQEKRENFYLYSCEKLKFTNAWCDYCSKNFFIIAERKVEK